MAPRSRPAARRGRERAPMRSLSLSVSASRATHKKAPRQSGSSDQLLAVSLRYRQGLSGQQIGARCPSALPLTRPLDHLVEQRAGAPNKTAAELPRLPVYCGVRSVMHITYAAKRLRALQSGPQARRRPSGSAGNRGLRGPGSARASGRPCGLGRPVLRGSLMSLSTPRSFGGARTRQNVRLRSGRDGEI